MLDDLGLWIKSRNRLGYYDAPTQFKMFWTASRVHLAPFVYGPGGNQEAGERLHVAAPFEERALAGQLELTARLAPQASVGVSARQQRDQLTGRRSTAVTLQAAFKTAR